MEYYILYFCKNYYKVRLILKSSSKIDLIDKELTAYQS